MNTRGTYAEYTNVPATSAISRPSGLDAVAAAALWVVYSTAYGSLIEKAGLQPGDHVLITAASSAGGLAAIQIANQIGAIPLAVTRSAVKKDDLLAAGAAAVITSDAEDVVQAAREYTQGSASKSSSTPSWGPGRSSLPRRPNSAAR